MKNHIPSIVVAAVLLAFLSGPANAEEADLKPLMRQNFQAMFALQKLAADPRKFADPGNAKVIRERIEQLAGISHILPEMMGQGRPGQAAIASVLSQYLSDLKVHLDRGNPEFLRNRVRTATAFCFECHTSLTNAKNVKDLEKRLDGADFPPAAKAEFYAATRQFDQAVEAYDQLLGHGGKTLGDSDIPQTVRNALSLSVRSKRDPKLTMDYLDKAEDLKDATPAFRSLVGAWKKDVASWKKEKDLPEDASSEKWLSLARDLVKRAQGLQKFPADHAGDVSYLRAINAVQEALARPVNESQKTEGFLLLGVAYAALDDPLLWALDDYYDEACIKSQPHSKWSHECYNALAKNVTFGFTGSSGTDLPPEERDRLKRLELLAK